MIYNCFLTIISKLKMHLFVIRISIVIFIWFVTDFCYCKGINELIFAIILFEKLENFIVIAEVAVLLPLPPQSAVTKGSFFRLLCQSSAGTKPLFFQWIRNGQTLVNSPESEYRIENNDDYSLFSIKSVDRSDSGNYSCIVRNAFGNDIQSALLTIKGLIK